MMRIGTGFDVHALAIPDVDTSGCQVFFQPVAPVKSGKLKLTFPEPTNPDERTTSHE